eukprot:45972-Pleurochrysis_carterae.AAC.1
MDAMDARKAETHSRPGAEDAIPMGITDTDAESSSSKYGDIIWVRASNAPPGGKRVNKSCAVTRSKTITYIIRRRHLRISTSLLTARMRRYNAHGTTYYVQAMKRRHNSGCLPLLHPQAL